jgi:hypothetical protein
MLARTPRRLPMRIALAGMLAALITAGSASASSYTITLDGTPLVVATTAANEVATVSFSGTAGQRVSIRITQVQMGTPTVTVKKPDNTVLKTAGPFSVSGGFIAPLTLPTTGTYKIVVDPPGTAKGSAKLEAWDVPADVSGSIATDGTLVTQTYTAPGQNGKLTFSGTAGQRITLLADGGSSTAKNVSVNLKAPSGAVVIAPTVTGFAGMFFGPLALPENGTYTLTSNPPSTTTGTTEFQLWVLPADLSGTIAVDGGNKLVSIGTPGQNAGYTFTGAVNQKVTVAVSPVALTGNPSTIVRIRKPDNSILQTVTLSNSGGLLEPMTLPAAGTYTIQVDPQKQAVGDVTLNAFTSVADLSGALTGGTPQTATFTAAGQNGTYTIAGTAGKYLSVNFGNDTVPTTKVTVLKPDGTALVAATSFNTAGKFIDATTLPVTGTYKIVVDPQGVSTGSLDITANVFPPVATFSAVVGTPIVVTTLPGQNASVTFTPAAGVTKVSTTFTSTTMGSTLTSGVTATLKQGATVVKSAFGFGNNGSFVDATTVTPGSVYTLSIDPQGKNSGSTTVTFYDVTTDATFSHTLNGASPSAISNTKPGQNIKVTFTGTIAHPLTMLVNNNTLADPFSFGSTVKLTAPGGTTNLLPISTLYGGYTWKELAAPLPSTGTYTLTIDPAGDRVGAMDFNLYDPPADSATTQAVTVGGGLTTAPATTIPGQNTQYTFTASSATQITINFDASNLHPAWISVIKVGTPNTVALAAPTLPYTQGWDIPFTPVSGASYIIKVDPQFEYFGTWAITLT